MRRSCQGWAAAVDEVARRKNLTFEQAEGLAPLPRQLEPKEVSNELRAVLWNYIHEQITEHVVGDYVRRVANPWAMMLKAVHVYREHRPADEFTSVVKEIVPKVKAVFMRGDYAAIYGWLQFVLRQYPKPAFRDRIASILNQCRAPYRIVDGCVLCPVASEAEAASIERAFVDLTQSGFEGARKHLGEAAAHLSNGNYSDSIRESIHAVESVARSIEPSAELSKALTELEKSQTIHPALKRGFSAIYGYTSDEKGIRHPLLDDAVGRADETDALFMMSACASFISYLVGKSRQKAAAPTAS